MWLVILVFSVATTIIKSDLYENTCYPYRFIIESKNRTLVTLTAEHETLKTLYKVTVNDDDVTSLTNQYATDSGDLYDLLEDLVANHCTAKQVRSLKTLVINEIDGEDELELNFTVEISLRGAKRRAWNFLLKMEKVQMNDLERLERVIKDLTEKVNVITNHYMPCEKSISLKGASFNERKNGNHYSYSLLSVDKAFDLNDARYQHLTFKIGVSVDTRSYIGVTSASYYSGGDVTTTDDTYWLQVTTGMIYSKHIGTKAYTWAAKAGDNVTVIVDVKKLYVGFSLNSRCEHHWAFHLKRSSIFASVQMISNQEIFEIVE
ncbi:unnamed protein product [Didymodactylos carnosus]|uniref:Uncharacterized protein n=1 Tax=Didymodactylos carnosus TaxID=1234261 RepID=A0A814IU05_9BILA|nr:unnamed protein product [Didymodactylos carnosus]CAF1026246.1 unnamed protein product [Didymodactylos carnosus]CAF3787190.1 unnamed protein product [Didymodactylos carnosus]CAF3797387.1 unnamed protein product [Didymodactylos carnosus]